MLGKAILLRFPGLDIDQLDIMLLALVDKGARYQFRAIIHANLFG